MNPPRSYRQGDLFLIESDLPAGATHEVARENDGSLILASGESNGHRHRILEQDNQLLEFADGKRYLCLKSSALLRHEEHLPIRLPPTIFNVIVQREYVPGAIGYRRVSD